MNMQAMLKQAQKLQSDMLKTQEEINNKEFIGKSSSVTVKVNGKKQLLDIKIDMPNVEEDEIEILQDMIIAALNEAFNQVDKETESKMGAYTKGMPGLF